MAVSDSHFDLNHEVLSAKGNEHSRVSRAAPRAGPATVARKCGPAGPSRGRGPAWADSQPTWAVPPEKVPEDPADELDVLY